MTHLTSAAGFSVAVTGARGVQGFPGWQESPTLCRVVGKPLSEKSDCGPDSNTTESLRISYRGNKVGEINLIGDIHIYLTV